jgi:cyclase
VAQSAPERTLHELANGVYVWLQPGGESGVSNAGVVVDDDGVTIIDTMMVRSQWEPFAEAVKAHAGVYASPQTSTVLDEPMPLEAYKAFMSAFEEEFDDLAELGTRPATHLIDGAASLTARVEVLPASGHTEGDVIVLVADADVCFAGDLCFFGVTPLAFQGDPARWADMLDAVAELADTIVPGHGPIGGEREVRELQGYLRACVAANGDPNAIPAGPWDSWIERERDTINVERAALLAKGEDVMPPSMLKAIGFG